MKMNTKAFVEGKTEVAVLKRVGFPGDIISSNGKSSINKKTAESLEPLLEIKPLRTLIMRDLDEGETVERLKQGIEEMIKKMFKNREIRTSIQVETITDNVFLFAAEAADFRLVLHVANYRWNEIFTKSTIDDYLLAIALEPQLAQTLAERQRIISGNTLIKKITEEIPDLLSKNGISLLEAKDYIGLYAAILKKHTSPSVFAQIVLIRPTIRFFNDIFRLCLLLLRC
ncbi:MAG: hypothetical protein NZM43_07975 [Saprospiraceae bacterium]|nr:hypothetical protein [Saprospiraceae bacterium]MDW8484245.1 hypothetical protein [Saprospiraceae bacterium]